MATEIDWENIRTRARRAPESVDDATLDAYIARIDEAEGTLFALLMDVAGRDPRRAPALMARYRSLMETRGAAGLAAAGYNLHEYGAALMDADWLRAAIDRFDDNPEGAWGIATAAAWHEPALLGEAELRFFEARAEAHPGACVEMLLLAAGGDPTRTDELVRRAIPHIERRPAETLRGASLAARHHDERLMRGDLVETAARHVAADPENGWELLGAAARRAPELFTDALLDLLTERAASGPKAFFGVLHRLAAAEPARERALMARYVAMLPAFPASALDEAYYLANNDTPLLRQDLVDAVCAHFAADAYKAYDILRIALHRRPELLHARHIETAVANIPHATNWAFGFFHETLKLRPEFAPLCTLALFDAIATEPPHRAFNRSEMIQDVLTIAQASHVQTELERALREPPSAGSRRARALMAILFRQRSRARQRVLFEAMRFISRATTRLDQHWTPLWDFFLLLLDESGEDAVSTAAAEEFLEGAFQLHFLMERTIDHDEFREQFDFRSPAPEPLPAAAGFLAQDVELTRLHGIVAALAKRFSRPLSMTPLREFERRGAAAAIELETIERKIAGGVEERLRRNLEARRATLRRNLEAWNDPAFELSASEKRRLARRVRDALRFELARIARHAVTGSRRELFRARLQRVLGREIEVEKVDPSVLPALLFLPSVAHLPNNRRYLARLIGDRIEGRPHDWLWTEPAAAEWKARVTAAVPGLRIDRWRAPFRVEFDYRPEDAAGEKRRRIRADLQRARERLAGMGVEGVEGADLDALRQRLAEVRVEEPPRAGPEVFLEIEQDLERVRIVMSTPESDYEGKIALEVETDPFEILFMGEYGFASCLSLRGSNVWAAVSNAIDVDKAIVWAKDPGGNVVGRRLIALTEDGVVSYRTYANRHGLALDAMFEKFLRAYAAHCGTALARGGGGRSPGPLLSDRWYDDGAV
jgi:hypothetical protein